MEIEEKIRSNYEFYNAAKKENMALGVMVDSRGGDENFLLIKIENDVESDELDFFEDSFFIKKGLFSRFKKIKNKRSSS